jgi:hypothetical protein
MQMFRVRSSTDGHNSLVQRHTKNAQNGVGFRADTVKPNKASDRQDAIVSSRVEGVFSERFGFVITDPKTLEHFHGTAIAGANLLERYTKTDEGELVAASGAAIPISIVPAGYYSVTFRTPSTSIPQASDPLVTSCGWILNVTSGDVALCGVGYLQRWDPSQAAVRHVQIPIGWYAVELRVFASTTQDDFALDVLLTRSRVMPIFHADVSKPLRVAERY